VAVVVGSVLGVDQGIACLVGSAAVLGNVWVLSILGPRLVGALARGRDPWLWSVALFAKFFLVIGLFLLMYRVLPAFGLLLGFVPLMLGTLATGLQLAAREDSIPSDGGPRPPAPHGEEV
jgi:hypothetical protein